MFTKQQQNLQNHMVNSNVVIVNLDQTTIENLMMYNESKIQSIEKT